MGIKDMTQICNHTHHCSVSYVHQIKTMHYASVILSVNKDVMVHSVSFMSSRVCACHWLG